MTLDYFDSRFLTGVIISRPPLYGLLTQIFFKAQAPANTNSFELHIISRGRKLLPAILDGEGARVVQKSDKSAILAKTPRFRAKMPFKASELMQVPAGYSPYNQVANPVEIELAREADFLRQDVDHTIEFMISKLVSTGKLEIQDKIDGKIANIYSLDNGMPDAHKITLSEKWDSSSTSILQDVEDWNALIMEETGFGATDLILGKNAYAKFLNHIDVKEKLDNRNINIGNLNLNIKNNFKGTWNGLNIWLDAATYNDYNNKSQYFIEPNSILLGTSMAENVIEYGLPEDLDCTGPTTYFAKTYKQEDPSAIWYLVESRPLPWAKQPGAFVCAKVL